MTPPKNRPRLPPLHCWYPVPGTLTTQAMRVVGGWLVRDGGAMCYVPYGGALDGAWGEEPGKNIPTPDKSQ